MSELQRNYSFYDGVILDAQIFENENDAKGTEDTANVHRAKEEILQLKKKFEIFVYTGQAEAYDDKTFNKVFKNVYDKGDRKDLYRLFADIKKAAMNQEDTQLRHTYKRVFEVCTEDYIGRAAGEELLSLLKVKDGVTKGDHFNSLRKIIELLFIAFKDHKLLPLEFVYPNIALNPTSRFLAGTDQRKTEFKKFTHFKSTHLPPQIATLLKEVLFLTQSGSHYDSEIDFHVRSIKTPYLMKSVLYRLFDILIWFKLHIDSNPPKENWKENK